MIEMLQGTFGLPVNGIVKGMNKNSGPFDAGAEQEARLVSLGLAKYVDEPVVEDAPVFDETPPELPELPDGVEAIPEYSIESKADELREIAKMCGLSFKVGMTKAEMVEALDKFFDENLVDDAEDESVVEDAPVFDATEAVQ